LLIVGKRDRLPLEAARRDGGLAGELDHVDGLGVAALLELVKLLDVEADRLAVLRGPL
jgi:hypothetical protein